MQLKCLTTNFDVGHYVISPSVINKPMKSFFIWTTLNGDTPFRSKIFALFGISAQGGVNLEKF